MPDSENDIDSDDDIDLGETLAYYRGRLEEHGPGAKGMDWKDEASQRLRFDVFARYIDAGSNPSILDVGCGSGAFLAFCNEQGWSVDYLGVDISREMVAACNHRFGDSTAVEIRPGELISWNRRFDYVIASGTFNARLSATTESWRGYFHGNICTMFRLAKVAAIVNCMSSFVDFKVDHLYYPEPAELEALVIARLGRNFILDHSYPLYEQTLVLYQQGCFAPSLERSGAE